MEKLNRPFYLALEGRRTTASERSLFYIQAKRLPVFTDLPFRTTLGKTGGIMTFARFYLDKEKDICVTMDRNEEGRPITVPAI